MSQFTTTPNLGLFKPLYDQDDDSWGDHLNLNADALDAWVGPGGAPGPFLPLRGGTMTGALRLPNGSMASPALKLGADDGTGLSRAADDMLFAVKNAAVLGMFSNSSAQFYGLLSLLGNRIAQVGDATAATDAVNLRTADARYLALGGGTVTGPLNVTATGGVTSRSVQDHFGEVRNVRDFGAVGDGTTNDTAAIQAAAAAIPANGGVLLFPPGNYLINATTTLKSNTVVYGPGATVTAAPKASWAGSAIVQGFVATGQNNITIDQLRFIWPVGYSNFGGGAAAQITSFTNCVHVQMLNVVSDGGSSQVSFLGCTDTLVQGCRATNVANCCYDHWQGSTDCRVIGCYGSNSNVDPHGGMSCVNFTGMNTDNTAATTTGFICTGNTLYSNVNDSQVISINGHTSGGNDAKVLIANNLIHVGSAAGAFGILVTGNAHNIVICNNYCEGGNGTYSAIAAYGPPATNVRIEHNVASGWAADSGHGIFQNQCVGGSLIGNTAYACSGPTVGPGSDASAMVYGNDAGTGTVVFPNKGVSFASQMSPGVSDLSHHVDLYGGVLGLSVTSGQMNYVVSSGVSHVFSVAGTSQLTVNGSGLTVPGALNLTGSALTCGWNGAGASNLNLNAGAGTYRALHWQNAGLDRWILTTDPSDNFVLWAQADAGSPTLSTPITITRLTGAIALTGNIGFRGAAPAAKPTITGSRNANAAVASLLTALAAYGLVTDSTTA